MLAGPLSAGLSFIKLRWVRQVLPGLLLMLVMAAAAAVIPAESVRAVSGTHDLTLSMAGTGVWLSGES